ncbi:hypothetical protein QZM71_22935 [Burkholderia multivorans]|nr:hypothetical protein [Burkholderia multivorans]MDN7477729.1 hypothetical protein [Burkholderia multivorans]
MSRWRRLPCQFHHSSCGNWLSFHWNSGGRNFCMSRQTGWSA